MPGRRIALAMLLLIALEPVARAELGTIIIGPNQPEAVVDAEKLIGSQPNTYELTVGGDQDGVLLVEVKPNQATMHPHMLLSDSARGTVGEEYADDDGRPMRMEVPIGPGHYTLEVDDSHRVNRQNPFRLTTRFTPASDRYEPNDRPQQAKRLMPGEYVQITLFKYKGNDQDWFFYKHLGGQLQVDVTAADGLTPQVKVLNDAKEEVGAGFAVNAGAELHFSQDLPEGPYFLVFSDLNGANLPAPLNVVASSH